jgi:hypothetical protein
MADSSMWATPSSADEARHRAVSPHEGRDYTLIPEYPTRDFGEGDVTFDPAYAQKALEKLNELLYLAVDRRGTDVVPPICGGTPGQPGSLFLVSSDGLGRCWSVAAVKVERPVDERP